MSENLDGKLFDDAVKLGKSLNEIQKVIYVIYYICSRLNNNSTKIYDVIFLSSHVN